MGTNAKLASDLKRVRQKLKSLSTVVGPLRIDLSNSYHDVSEYKRVNSNLERELEYLKESKCCQDDFDEVNKIASDRMATIRLRNVECKELQDQLVQSNRALSIAKEDARQAHALSQTRRRQLKECRDELEASEIKIKSLNTTLLRYELCPEPPADGSARGDRVYSDLMAEDDLDSVEAKERIISRMEREDLSLSNELVHVYKKFSGLASRVFALESATGPVHDWAWAREQLEAGQLVRRRPWVKPQHYYMRGESLFFKDARGVQLVADDLQPINAFTDWEVV